MQKRCWQAQHASQISSLRSDHGLTAFIIRSFLEAATKAGLNVLETDPLKIRDFPQHRPSFKSKVKRFSCGSGKSFGTWISQLPETCLFSSVCSLKAQDLIKPWDWPLKKNTFLAGAVGPRHAWTPATYSGSKWILDGKQGAIPFDQTPNLQPLRLRTSIAKLDRRTSVTERAQHLRPKDTSWHFPWTL